MNVFAEYARYYDLFYKEKNYAEEARNVIDIIIKHNPNIKNILIVGCGTGRHDREFVKLGDYEIEGIDLSKGMLEIASEEAKKQGLSIRYTLADARRFDFNYKFDAIISLFHVMSYQITNKDIKDVFISVEKSLKKDGVFIFDCWYGPGVLSDMPAVRVKSVEDDRYRFVRTAQPQMFPNDNLVDVNYHIMAIDKESNVVSEIDEKHSMRYFFKPELEEYLNECGMKLLECISCETLSEPSFSSWTAYCTCRKME